MVNSLPALWRESQRLLNAGNPLRAKKHLYKVLTAFPSDYASLTNLAALYYNEGDDGQALIYIDRALKTEQGRQSLHTRFTNALIKLRTGQWREGWLDFEFRFPARAAQIQGDYEHLWRGGPLGPDRAIYLWGEQGLGDQIMMARFVPEVKRISGAKVCLVVDPSLHSIFEGLADEIVPTATTTELHFPLLSLPRALNLTPETLDGKPYLQKPSIGEYAGPRRIGFCFRSASAHADMVGRYVPESLFNGLRESRTDVSWLSLQQGYEDFEPSDFSDTAIRAAGCSLVITIDTSIAHLCGAMGIPTWLLLKRSADFRWLKGETTPWYSSVRIYRQPKQKDWFSVIQRVKEDLKNAA